MRAAQTTICADAALTQSARRRVRIGASRSGRGSCAARIQEWLSPRCRGSHLRAVEAAVVCSPVGSGATMRSALHACLRCRSFCSECGEVPNRRADRLLRCGTSFFEAPTVRSGRQSVLGSRSQFACSARLDCVQSIHVRGWRGLDQTQPGLRHFQPGALFRFIAGEVRHPLTFGGIRAIFVILVHGRFRQWLSFVNRQTCRLFQLQRYFGHRGVGRAELEKAGVRRLAAVGNNLRAPSLGYFFIRLFLRPWADCGCWVCCAT